LLYIATINRRQCFQKISHDTFLICKEKGNAD
jgi:hypothetical protein